MKIKIQIKLYKKQMMEQLEKTCTVRKQGQIDETETRKIQKENNETKSVPQKTTREDIGFPGGSVVRNSFANAGDADLIPGSGRSPREGNGNSSQYPHLGNPTDGGAWQVAVHGVTKELDMTESLNNSKEDKLLGILTKKKKRRQKSAISRKERDHHQNP